MAVSDKLVENKYKSTTGNRNGKSHWPVVLNSVGTRRLRIII